MALYLTRFSYTPETWARLIGNPEDRRKAAQEYIESVGGKLHGSCTPSASMTGTPLGGSGQRVHGRRWRWRSARAERSACSRRRSS